MTPITQFYDLTPYQRSKRYFVALKSGIADLLYALPQDGDPRASYDYFHYTYKEYAHRSGDKRYADEQQQLREDVSYALSKRPYDSDYTLQAYNRDCKRMDKKYLYISRQALADALRLCYNKYLPRAKMQGKRLVFAWVGDDDSASAPQTKPPWAKDVNVPRAISKIGYELVEINGYKTATRCNICHSVFKTCWAARQDRSTFKVDCNDPDAYGIIDGLRLCDSPECRQAIPDEHPYRIMNLDKIILCNAISIVNSLKRPQFLKYSTKDA
ncbi:hypothetical protein E3P86_03548 [Wallemia ichthyophaga]|uniref:Uncharacterized protein n=1 Tax=Wallemia ichthyophaga TaxID=245174 RepID=A0A4T0IJW1_WALIC|nr:hypothetical protein E3P86_03548 [Wallemia ichthyophaga]